MDKLLKKLYYKGQKRIAVINAGELFLKELSDYLPGVQADTEIDPRFPYEFMLIFVINLHDIEQLAPMALHNLITDGTLWFAFPKKTCDKTDSDIDREHGWEILTGRGFERMRYVSLDRDWSALRFRNIRFMKSSSERFNH
jgi:hypothetical protein